MVQLMHSISSFMKGNDYKIAKWHFQQTYEALRCRYSWRQMQRTNEKRVIAEAAAQCYMDEYDTELQALNNP